MAEMDQYGNYVDPLAKYNGGVSTYGHSQQVYNPQAWGGEGYYYDENGKAVDGTTGAEKDATRYQSMGNGAQQVAPVQLDQTQANQSRGVQVGSLALLENAAQGNAPSQAAILGRSAGSDAMRAAQMQQAGARGGAASIGAARMAGIGAGNQTVQNLGQFGTMRAKEMAQNMGQFSTGADQMRGGDLTAATKNAQLDATQRALAQQQQQQYEKMAWNTRNADMQAQNESATQQAQQALALRKQRDAEHQADVNNIMDTAKIGAGVVMGVV